MMTTVTNYLTAAELYAEIQHTRGNFSLFEFEANGDWVEVDVWELRRRPEQLWQELFDIFANMDEGLAAIYDPHDPEMSSFRVTRYPELEKDSVDAPYHPMIASWQIDPQLVFEHFNEKESH